MIKDFDRHLNARGWAAWGRWPGLAMRGGCTIGTGRLGEGDEADGRGPHGSDVRERRYHCWNAQARRKDAFW
jgi:hypothetical protein